MPSKKPAAKKTGKPVVTTSKLVVKKASPAKKAAPAPAAKKPVPTKKAAPAPAKKALPVKKSAPVPTKKAVPAPVKKVVPAKPVAKAAPAKKAAPVPIKKPIAAKPAAKPVVTVQAKAAPHKAVTPVSPKNVQKTVAKSASPSVKPVAKPAAKPIPAPAPAPAPVAPVQKLKVPVVKAPPTPPVKPVRKAPEPIKDIKLPKTNVKTSVQYKPMYTPLEKREELYSTANQSIIKYSDTDLNDFRELISKKLEAAKKELAYLQGLITRKDEMGGDNDDARYMTMEDGSMSMEREQLSQMASRQITYIDHLEKAIMRIENKTYGICRVTGKLIDKARLRAVPHATLSLEAKLGLARHHD